MFLNALLTVLTMFNIKQERWEKELMEEEKARQEKEAELAEKAAAAEEN